MLSLTSSADSDQPLTDMFWSSCARLVAPMITEVVTSLCMSQRIDTWAIERPGWGWKQAGKTEIICTVHRLTVIPLFYVNKVQRCKGNNLSMKEEEREREMERERE